TALVDEAALAADAERWVKLRRTHSAVASLAKLAEDKAPLAAAILRSPQWVAVRTVAQADTTRPGVDDLRVARLLGDAALEARTKAVLEDRVTRLAYELRMVLDPSNAAGKDDLAYLDRK
ncbi:MAG TPA: hypothetical protein VK427_23190, partial [Kofleriaceae bacterium]|nr:hypothetical protein [Kofleriaceae bacterium]